MALQKRETGRGYSVADYTSATLSSSTVETTLFTQTIVAGSMGIAKELNFRIICTLTTVLAPPTLTIKMKFGASTLTVMSGLTLSTSLTSSPFIIEGVIANVGSSTAQIVYAKLTQASSTILLAQPMAYADWTIDTTTDQTFSVTAQFGSSSATTVLTYKHANVDLT